VVHIGFDGGIFLSRAADILCLKDTNGDGRADRCEVILTGFFMSTCGVTIHTGAALPREQQGNALVGEGAGNRTDASGCTTAPRS